MFLSGFTGRIKLSSFSAGFLFFSTLFCSAETLQSLVMKGLHSSPEQALEYYTQAISLAPQDELLYVMRAGTNREMENYEAVIEDCNTAIALNPELSDAYRIRAEARRILGDIEGADSDDTKASEYKTIDYTQTRLTKNIQNNPTNHVLYLKRAKYNSRTGNNEGAIEDYTKYIQLAGNTVNPMIYAYRAKSYERTGDLEAAIEDYTYLIDTYPEYAIYTVYTKRAILRQLSGDYEGSQNDYDKARESRLQLEGK